MLKKIIDFITGRKPAPAEPVVTAPYKVPEPAAVTPIPLVVATPPPVVVEPVAKVVVETAAAPEKKKRTYAKKPAVPTKPAAIKAPAKPRTKKTL